MIFLVPSSFRELMMVTKHVYSDIFTGEGWGGEHFGRERYKEIISLSSANIKMCFSCEKGVLRVPDIRNLLIYL